MDIFVVVFSACALVSTAIVYSIFRLNKRKLRFLDFLYLGHIFIFSCVLFFLYTVIYYSLLFREVRQPFDRAVWNSDKEKRAELVDDLVGKGMLRSKSRGEVLDLLGSPSYVDTVGVKTRLFYYAGFKNKLFAIDPYFLGIELQGGAVSNYFIKVGAP